jgi:hypothetical protein
MGVEDVLDLGESMVEQGRVPDLDYSSASSSTSGMDPALPQVFNQPPHTSPISSTQQLRRARSPIPSRHTIPPAPPAAPSQVLIHHQSKEETSLSESEVPEIREVRQSFETSHSDPGEGPSTLNVEGAPESSVSTSAYADGDFISVQRTSDEIHFDPVIFHESISGYVATSNSVVKTAALLDRELPENIISLALATQLGLQLEDTDESKWIYIGKGTGKKSRGRVVLKWSQGAFLDHTPLRVHCWVYEDDQATVLVFGNAFVGKRSHYWEATKIREG